jgi:hypothetical protein
LSYQSPTLKISKIHVCYQFFFGWPHGNGFWFGNKAVECPLDVFLKYLVRVVKIVLGGGGGGVLQIICNWLFHQRTDLVPFPSFLQTNCIASVTRGYYTMI